MLRTSKTDPKHPTPGERMIAGLQEVIDLKRAGIGLATRLVVRTYDIPDPSAWPPARVRELRGRLGVAQPLFAKLAGVSTILVQAWEQGKRTPAPLAARLLDTMAADPAAWLRMIGAEVPNFPRPAADGAPVDAKTPVGPTGKRPARRRKTATAAA